MKKRIYYHDTDCGGVVYYANYLKYLEEARTEYLEESGISVSGLAKEGTLFVVSHQEIDYKFPGRLADILDITTRIASMSGARIEFEYEIKNQDGQVIAKAQTTLVCIDKSFRPQVIPDEIRKKLK